MVPKKARKPIANNVATTRVLNGEDKSRCLSVFGVTPNENIGYRLEPDKRDKKMAKRQCVRSKAAESFLASRTRL